MLRFKISSVFIIILAAMALPAFLLVPGQDSYLPDQEQNLNLAVHAFKGARAGEEAAQEATASQMAACPQLGAALVTPAGDDPAQSPRSLNSALPEKQPVPLSLEERQERHQKVWEQLTSWQTRCTQSGEVDTGEAFPATPDLMVVVDARGEGVANQSDHTWFGSNLANRIPAIAEPLRTGHRARHLWKVEGALMDVVIQPMLRGDGAVIGALILGFAITDQTAQAYSQVVHNQVILAAGNRTVATSQGAPDQGDSQLLIESGARENTEIRRVKLGKSHLLVRELPVGGLIQEAKLEGDQGHALKEQDRNHNTTGLGPTPLRAFLIRDVSQGATATTRYFLTLGAIFAGLVLLSLFFTNLFVSSFLRPFRRLTEGVNQVLGGNLHHVFTGVRSKKNSPVGSISTCLNVLLKDLRETRELCDELIQDGASSAAAGIPPHRPLSESGLSAVSRIQGGAVTGSGGSRFTPMFPYQTDSSTLPMGDSPATPRLDEAFRKIASQTRAYQQEELLPPFGEESEEPGVQGGPGGSVSQSGAPASPSHTSAPVQENQGFSGPNYPSQGDMSYYQNLFREYLAARKANGESYDNITFEIFHAKIIQSEALIKEKSGFENIIFKIQLKDGRVSLKPMAID